MMKKDFRTETLAISIQYKFVVVFVLLLLSTVAVTYANSAAPRNINHSIIQFDDQTGIELISEQLDIVVNSGY
jgi:hypothetical protein